MVAAFATVTDLGNALNRTFTGAEQVWVTTLLQQAAGIMRGVMRSQVYPSTQSTYTAYPVGGRVDLPQSFVRSVDAVKQGGVGVTYTRRQDTIQVASDDPTDITFTYGLSVAPDDLIGINCALVSGAMQTVAAGLGLNAGGLSSVAIDDFKAAWADGGASSGMTPTPFTIDYLQTHYGRTAWVVQSL